MGRIKYVHLYFPYFYLKHLIQTELSDDDRTTRCVFNIHEILHSEFSFFNYYICFDFMLHSFICSCVIFANHVPLKCCYYQTDLDIRKLVLFYD